MRHNAVSPFGMITKIPFIICERIVSVTSPIEFRGGGYVDVKLEIPLDEFIRTTNATVTDISDLR